MCRGRNRGARRGMRGRAPPCRCAGPFYPGGKIHCERILVHVEKIVPKVIVVDSIQTVFTSSLESAPGTVSQVRESAGRLMMLAKQSGIPVFLVGHVTKDVPLPGPRVSGTQWWIRFCISRETRATLSDSARHQKPLWLNQ